MKTPLGKTDATTTVEEIKRAFALFRDERGWDKGHTPRSIAISVAIEAAELMEHFQWGDFKEAERQEVADELADVIHYCMDLADVLGIDVSTVCRDKLERAKQKYPVELFYPGHHDSAAYHQIKQAYRQKGRKTA